MFIAQARSNYVCICTCMVSLRATFGILPPSPKHVRCTMREALGGLGLWRCVWGQVAGMIFQG